MNKVILPLCILGFLINNFAFANENKIFLKNGDNYDTRIIISVPCGGYLGTPIKACNVNLVFQCHGQESEQMQFQQCSDHGAACGIVEVKTGLNNYDNQSLRSEANIPNVVCE